MTFHWFLPTSGDGDQVGAATVTAGAARHDRAATVGVPGRRSAGPPRRPASPPCSPRSAPAAPTRGSSARRSPSTPSGSAAGRRPGRLRAAHPDRPAGRGVPVRSPAAGSRSTSSPAATRPSSGRTATSSTTTRATPAPASSSRCSAAPGRAGRSTTPATHYRVDGGGLATPLADAAAGLLRRRVPGRRGGGRPARRRLPDVG